MWKHLTHTNILPLRGITITPFQLISDWTSDGDLPGYIEKNPNTDRLKLVGAIPPRYGYLVFTPLSAIRRRSGSLLPPFL